LTESADLGGFAVGEGSAFGEIGGGDFGGGGGVVVGVAFVVRVVFCGWGGCAAEETESKEHGCEEEEERARHGVFSSGREKKR